MMLAMLLVPALPSGSTCQQLWAPRVWVAAEQAVGIYGPAQQWLATRAAAAAAV